MILIPATSIITGLLVWAARLSSPMSTFQPTAVPLSSSSTTANTTFTGNVNGTAEAYDDGQNQTRSVRADEESSVPRNRNGNKLVVVDTIVEQLAGSDYVEPCSGARRVLIPFFNGSKYYADPLHRYKYSDGKQLCEQADLVIAEIDSPEDFRSVEAFFNRHHSFSFNPETDKYYIGLNDIKTEGVYLRSDSQPIKFQHYHTSQPDDKGQAQDCSVIGKESMEGPVGMFDEGCNRTFHVICMLRETSECLPMSLEEISHQKSTQGLHSIYRTGSSEYFVSTFQSIWQGALDHCREQGMTLFDMDSQVTITFFTRLGHWETGFFNTDSQLPIQYWTSGRFQASHMDAPIYWHTGKRKKSTQEELLDHKSFTFSGIFRWSSQKPGDPGSAYDIRRDLCLSFSLELSPDVNPYVRNTNCALPLFFVCRKDGVMPAEEMMMAREKRDGMVHIPGISKVPQDHNRDAT